MVAVLLAGTLLAVLNQTLLSPALPSIMRDLSIDATTAQWLTSGYALVEVIVIPSSAYLIGRFTTRQLFTGGLVAFCAGSALCACAPSFPIMLLGRALQAVCTGSIMAMVISIILLIFPISRRGFAMGLVNLIIGFAPAVGLSMLPGSLLGAFTGLISGRLFDKFGPRPIVLTGGALALAGVVGMCLLTADSSMAVVTACYSVFLFGLMAVGAPLNTWGVNSLDNSVMQHANAVSNTLNQIAASFGTALIVSLTTLPGVLNPHADAASQLFLGDHYAFIGTAVALAAAFLIMFAFVRESFPARKAKKQVCATQAS